MKIRRLFALALVVCVMPFAAQADGTVALDHIGMRYTPAEGERYVTRDHMDAQALSAFGTDSDTMLASMKRDGLYLISLQADGRQYTLGVSDAPDGIAVGEYAKMTADQKADFLTLLAREGGYGNATWKNGGYALFSSQVQNGGGQPLSYANLALSTLYQNRVYTFGMELVGREATQADIDLLLSAATRTLRLGACALTDGGETAQTAPQALTLPDVTVTGNPVQYQYQNQGCDLALDPVADTIGVTRFALSGVTVPGGYLRYAVNGKSSSRIKAEDSGAFNVTVPNLTGDADNLIEVTAFKGSLKTTVTFTVRVDWQVSPLAMESAGEVQSDTTTLRGLTLPGSSVELSQGRGSRVSIGEDGSFTLTLSLPRLGSNDFTLQVQSPGYHRNDYAFTVARAQSAQDALARLQKQVRTVAYTKLTAKPSGFANRVVQLNGQASDLAYNDGSPSFVLTDETGNRYTVRCADLLGVANGADVELLGTLTGTLAPENKLPEVTLEALL